MLELEAIAAALADTQFAGGLHYFPSIGSTNTYALQQVQECAPHGSFYVADEQTAGRGRSDHRWHSAAGEGLYLSMLLRLEWTAAELAWLPLLAGLVTHGALVESAQIEADLRWPNDILIGPKKVAGILVEAPQATDSVRPVVVGIGVNVHQRGFSPDLATAATSLDLASGRRISRQRVLIALLQSLHAELGRVARDREAALAGIPARFAAVSSWVSGRAVDVHGPQACQGVTAGLDDRGFLRVQTADGLATVTTGGIRAAKIGE